MGCGERGWEEALARGALRGALCGVLGCGGLFVGTSGVLCEVALRGGPSMGGTLCGGLLMQVATPP